MKLLPVKNIEIDKWQIHKYAITADLVAVEAPLQIILIYRSETGTTNERIFTTTMRSPGDDQALTIGLLYAEGVITSIKDIEHIRYCIKTETSRENTLKVTLKSDKVLAENVFNRSLMSTGSCGICGQRLIEDFQINSQEHQLMQKASIATIISLPQALRQQQLLFEHTGGIHACGLFTSGGSLIHLSEDIGRHNALDKIIGKQLVNGGDFKDTIIVLSGRVGFEMAQKTARAGIPILVAIGAPTSMAVEIAQKANFCLLGFVKNKSVNCYHNPKFIDFEK